MNREDLNLEIDIKYGEILEMLPIEEVPIVMVGILVNMLIETRNLNEYYKKRIDACQRFNKNQENG